jgi:predicted TIM-barrel fold metal-dependent hydrolase
VYLVVIDAHLHPWNTERLRYEWLQRPENAVIDRTFGFADFRSRAVQPRGSGTAARSYALRTASG